VNAPKSPYNLIQETVQHDPWRVLIVCIFCNLTKRVVAEPYMWQFFDRWPTADDAAKADPAEIREMIGVLGLADRRSKTLVRLSQAYVNWDRVEVRSLPGVGEYAAAAYHIFCLHRWNQIPEPKDGALKNYWKWINGKEESQIA
jgi:methyl-CpG-binding domain protein 4